MIKKANEMPVNPISLKPSDLAKAERLYAEGFNYIYQIGKKVYASNAALKRTRLIQGGFFENLVRPINLRLMFTEMEKEKEATK